VDKVILKDLFSGVDQVAPGGEICYGFIPGTCLTTQSSGRICYEFIPGICL